MIETYYSIRLASNLQCDAIASCPSYIILHVTCDVLMIQVCCWGLDVRYPLPQSHHTDPPAAVAVVALDEVVACLMKCMAWDC